MTVRKRLVSLRPTPHAARPADGARRARCALLGALLLLPAALVLAACGDDDDGGGTEADRLGVGAACATNEDCTVAGQVCLPFKGGYCGIENCTADADCPQGSLCVAHDDGKNYCFRVCVDKADCNLNRPPEVASNCSSNVTFVEGKKGSKACVPPS